MKSLIRSCKQVFMRPGYIFLAVLVTFIFFLITIWLPIRELIIFIIFSDTYSFFIKGKLLLLSLSSLYSNFTLLSAIFVVITSFLIGVNISMLVYYMRARSKAYTGGAVGLIGMFSGILGIGCASCGSVILTSLLGVSASGYVIRFLPFGGEEFSMLGVLLLGISIYLLGKKIQKPLVCEIS
ncbi:MAG: hypothetical protein HN726_02445 [Candidatus Magasanikbacteria bacterium]|nr:hypothetical protein [Candidatus Magasanikbacteria bacterium]MBT4221430.1 hypothetical protein [Candidatus Magasanikbacteria bacterium]MBT4350722.1 hypothetical protein [Candidatus Magasanikbacteria bacterium]MBT4541602.1 hypothetical protein [Candidatus Magasanikbacteria bacterium]MBT6252955.1 hypothetical protein [Candidatus Magasanikbacteria bacterium]